MSRDSQASPSLFPPSLLAVKYVAGRHWFGAYRNVVICYWQSTCTADEVRGLRTIYRSIASDSGTAVSVLHYVEQGVGLPAPNLRTDLASNLDASLPSLNCIGVVLAGAGFWVSALSSFIVGVRMLMPSGSPHFRVARDLDEMKPWFVAEHQRATGERIDPSSLNAWIEQARAAMTG
jgi:hypothetical protein